jgi:hypothetical protein
MEFELKILNVDEAEVIAGRFRAVSGRHYVLHDPEKLGEKYANAWNNFGIKFVNLKKYQNVQH